ncbi:MAG: hypothetical protein DRP79_02635 [Planctomycetota bacterium]|nr:MAG: hypothetical protein DRP79_02635 [Planctomycetota bacterium]
MVTVTEVNKKSVNLSQLAIQANSRGGVGMQKASALVTDGAGFIGAHVAEHLVKSRYAGGRQP